MDASGNATAAAAPPAAWTCGSCGYDNGPRALCARCGVSRAWLENPPLDVPPAPRAAEQPATWLGLLHAGLAVLGTILLLRPEVAPYLALRPSFQGLQIAISLAAAWSALNQAAMDRRFRETTLKVPARSPVDRPLEAHATLVPYEAARGVHVTLAVLSKTYQEPKPTLSTDRQGMRMRSRVVARHRLLEGGRLPGRRASEFTAAFDAPYPSPDHRSVGAELEASLLGAFAWLVPGLGDYARNLREHGGIWVRLTVRAGPWRRRIEKRVMIYHVVGDHVQIG